MKRWVLAFGRFALGYTELVFVPAVILAWEYFTKTRLSADARSSLYAGGFIAISFWNWHKATARAELAEAAAKKPETPARIFAEGPEVLIAHLSDPKVLTQMQVVRYYDKWITLAGRVECTACTYATLILERGQRVNVHFDVGEESKLQDMRKGQYLTVVCQVRPAYSHSRVALENGEVIRLSQERFGLARVS